MLFDLSTICKAKETLAKFLKLDLKILENCLEEYSEDDPVRCIKDYIPKDAQSTVEKSIIKIFHMTTTIDGLAFIKGKGLLDLDVLLSTNSPLTNFLKRSNIEYDKNKQTLLIEGKEVDIDQENFSYVKQRLTIDANINGFYYIGCKERSYSLIKDFPEFLMDLDTVLGRKYQLGDKWAKSSTPYVLEIEIPWRDGDKGGVEVNEEMDFDEFLERLVSRAAGTIGHADENIFYVRRNRKILPKEIKSFKKLK